MPDNVQITQGSGTTVRTDDVSGVHYQVVKLADGTDGSDAVIPGGAQGLSVQGQVAHDATAAGRPVTIAGVANATAPTAVDDGDAAQLWVDRRGGLVVGRARTARTTLTFAAGLQGLASSSTVGQVSAAVNLSASLPADVIVEGFFSRGTGTLSGVIEVYAIGSLDGSVWSGDVPGYSGSAGSYTLTVMGSPNLAMVGVVRPNSASDTIHRGIWSLRSAFGFVPPWFAIVVVNNCGITLSSSGQGVAIAQVW